MRAVLRHQASCLSNLIGQVIHKKLSYVNVAGWFPDRFPRKCFRGLVVQTMSEVISPLEPMRNDPVNYVRQGALVSSALILIQKTEQTCPKVKDFRQLYAKVISDKHDDVMAKFGAILAQGIIDAGGRNVTISVQSRTGHTNMVAVVGMLFAQFWCWFSLSHFLSLAFTPTAIIGLNADLKALALEEKKEKDREKVTTVVLSIIAKARKKESEKKEREEKMDVVLIGGIIMKKDNKSDDPEKLVEPVAGKEYKLL
ncbi:26S proteasome non-ATPase regulatory subunit 1 [Araneus ventricosus]|uniref:26S proteasome non-ATPase regulatory subunit 1 n=1 Tax=Araneus ventricosus TaxID=182803 RepID=A0A4Y2G851_ARAVE|nr:26S proteasome non-ATPase regulatory subunit 1 [Araneus ventricosus]